MKFTNAQKRYIQISHNFTQTEQKMELIKFRNLHMFLYLPIKIAEPKISGYQPVS
jgi:hypothetical protein